MSFWSFIGEFFLFRWLFGGHPHDASRHDTSAHHPQPPLAEDYGSSHDDFLDEQDDYDMMDDFM